MADAKIVLSAVDQTAAAFQGAKSGLQGLHTSATSVTAALGVLGVAGAALTFAASIKGAIDAADQINKLSQRTGIAAESLSQLQFAAKLADVSTDTLTTGIKKLNVSIAEGLGGDKAKVEMFRNLGISLKDASGQAKSADKILLEMAGTFSTAKDGATKTAYAVGLMGKAGDEMIPLLNGGTAAITDMMGKADKLGLTIGADFARQAEEFNDNLAIMKASSDKLAISLGSDLVNGLGRAMKAMADAAVEGGNLRGILAGLQTLMTGDDRHKANVGMVETADKILTAENDLLKLQAGNAKTKNAFTEAAIEKKKTELGLLRNEYAAHQAIGKEIDSQAVKAAAAVPKQSGSLKALTGGATNTSTESDFSKYNKELEKRLALESLELEVGGKLSDMDKFSLEVIAQLTDKSKKYTEAEREQLLVNADKVALVIKDNTDAKKAMEIAVARQKQREDEAKGIAQFDREQMEAANARIKSGKDMLEQIEFDTRALTMNAQEREQATVARELERLGIVKGTQAWAEYGEAITKASGEKAATQKAIDDFRGVWESVDRTAHDTFVNIFEGGKDAFTKLRDTLKATLLDLLYQMTVKKWTFNIAASVTGTAGGIANSVAQGSGGLSGLSMLGGSAGAGLMTGLSSWGGGLAGVGGALEAGAGLIGSGSIAGGLGMLAGALGPVAIALGVIASFAKSGGGPKTEAGYSGGLSIAGRDIGGNLQGSQRGDVSAAQKISEGISGSYEALAKQLGLVNQKLDVGIFYSMDNAKGGTSLTQLQVTSSAGYNRSTRAGGIENVARGEDGLKAALAEETVRLLVDGLKGSDLPQQFKDVFNAIAPEAGLTEMQAALTRVTKARGEQLTLEEQLFQLTATDLDKLNKVREKERAAIDPLNASMLDQVYAQQDLKTATDAAAAATTAAIEKAKGVASERAGLDKQIMQLTGDITGLRKLELDAMDESNRPLQDRIYLLQDEADATVKAAQAISAAALASDAWFAGMLAIDRAAEEARQAQARALFDTGKGISDFIRQLSTGRAGTASPQSLLEATRNSYLSDLSGARIGNVDAAGRVSNSAQAYIEAQKGYTASGGTTQAVISQVISELSALPSVQSYQDQSLELLRQQIAATTGTTAAVNAFAGLQDAAMRVHLGEISKITPAVDQTTGAVAAAAQRQAEAETAAAIAKAAAPSPTINITLPNYVMRFDGSVYDANAVAPAAGAYVPNYVMRPDGSVYDANAVPAFAAGGDHAGGARLVGERGPELEITGPSRIYNAAQTQRMLGGDSREVLAELRELRHTVAELMQRQLVLTAEYARRDLALGQQTAAAAARAQERAVQQEARAVTQ